MPMERFWSTTAKPRFPARAWRRGFHRQGADQPRPHQADLLPCLAQPVHRFLGLGGKTAHHHQGDLRILAAVCLHGAVASAKQGAKLTSDFAVGRYPVEVGQMGLVAEVGIGRAAQHRNPLADRLAATKMEVGGIKRREELVHAFLLGDDHRLAG